MKKQLIISIGSGRCGSVSLSKFLSAQKLTNVIHEGRIDDKKIRKLIKWENDENELFKWLEYLISFDNSKFIGDTGMYFLPYIQKIIQKYPSVKILNKNRKTVIHRIVVPFAIMRGVNSNSISDTPGATEIPRKT